MPSVTLIQGDNRKELKKLPEKHFHTAITSPPYFGLRSYLPEASKLKRYEIGTEKTPDQFTSALVDTFSEMRRVMRDDATFWLDLGDSYCNTDKWGGGVGGNTGKHTMDENGGIPSWAVRKKRDSYEGFKPKDLLGIPWRVAFALQASGWYLRSAAHARNRSRRGGR